MRVPGGLLTVAAVAFAVSAQEIPPASDTEERPPHEVTAGIRSVVSRMQSSIRREDSGAYMLAVDTLDPVFAEEQRKWARDFTVFPIDSVEVRVMAGSARPGQSIGIPGDLWVAPIWFGWTLPGEDERRTDAYLARFRPIGLVTGAWVFSGRVWERHPADGVRLLHAPDDRDAAEMAEYLADHVGRLREAVEAELGETLPLDPTIKIYPDMESLQASIALSYTTPLGGWNEPGESIKLLSRPGAAGPRLDVTVAHELGHAVSFEWGDAIVDAPWWALEGIAEVAADPFRSERFRNAEDAAAGLARSGGLMAFERLSDFRGEAMDHIRQVYVQGRSMVAYITGRFGPARRNAWFGAMGSGRSIDDASRSELGVSFQSLDRAWRTSLVQTDSEELPD
ncbi:MAG: hypothetical protein AAGA55_00185 [Planctomycetota bacterium]